MYGLDTRYDTGTADPHPMAGQLGTRPCADHPGRCFQRRGTAAPGPWRLLDLTEDGSLAGDGHGWKDRVDIITAHCTAPPAAALLIRPDGYVAWAAPSDTPGSDGLRHALTTWFGTPAPLRRRGTSERRRHPVLPHRDP